MNSALVFTIELGAIILITTVVILGLGQALSEIDCWSYSNTTGKTTHSAVPMACYVELSDGSIVLKETAETLEANKHLVQLKK
ncbi:MAG: hypothetical protein AAF542_18030 [Pseudomonadota bacterium]